MSTAAEQARSTRSDARGFADAFSAADDAFTFEPPVGESRTMTLTELEAVLELEMPVDVGTARATPPSPPPAAPDAGLLTLAELGDVLAAPAAPADDLDFDFGSGTAERARRRTAARTDATAPASTRRRTAAADAGLTGRTRVATRLAPPSPSHAPQPPSLRSSPRAAQPARAPKPAALAPQGAPRPLPGSAALHRFRADPDRIALYAVLLGILLVLIAASSSSASAVTTLTLQLL